MTAWEKLRFNQVTTLEKVIQNKIGFTTLRCVIGQKKILAALLTNQMQNYSKSWSFHVLPWFLVGCLLYLHFLDWMFWIPRLSFVALEWKEFFFDVMTFKGHFTFMILQSNTISRFCLDWLFPGSQSS